MLVFQRCFNLCFIALLVHLLCAFHFVLASPGKKTASVNALVGVPVPGKSAERANPLSSSSPALSPEQSAAKRPKFDLNRTPSPETEEGARSASPRLSRGIPPKKSKQTSNAESSQRFYWKLKKMTKSDNPLEAQYAEKRLQHRRRLNTISARKRRAADRAKKLQGEAAQQN